jgi:hypothetical protein
MLSRTTQAFALALTLWFMGATLTMVTDKAEAAVNDRVTGTVIFVDADTGLLWLQATDRTLVKIAAPTTLLGGLQVDQRVELAIRDTPGIDTADGQTHRRVSAQVQNVEAANDLLRLKTPDGELIDVQSSALSLDNLQTGTDVEVTLKPAGA